MSKKITNTASASDKDEYLPTVDTPIKVRLNNTLSDSIHVSQYGVPPFEVMHIVPSTVLDFNVRDGFWVVVTNDGQKHLYPLGDV